MAEHVVKHRIIVQMHYLPYQGEGKYYVDLDEYPGTIVGDPTIDEGRNAYVTSVRVAAVDSTGNEVDWWLNPHEAVKIRP